jgi:type IV fimbrial biogenesis protein FimT
MDKSITACCVVKRRSRGFSGFTLIELLVTLAIAAIAVAIAIPNFTAFVQNNRLVMQANDLVSALNYARSEAIKRGVRVSVCSRQDDANCLGAATWNAGWLVFVDPDGDGVVDLGENVLSVRQALEGGNTLLSASIEEVTYQNTGFSGFAGILRLCDMRGTANGRAIVTSAQGRVRTSTVAAEATTCP